MKMTRGRLPVDHVHTVCFSVSKIPSLPSFATINLYIDIVLLRNIHAQQAPFVWHLAEPCAEPINAPWQHPATRPTRAGSCVNT